MKNETEIKQKIDTLRIERAQVYEEFSKACEQHDITRAGALGGKIMIFDTKIDLLHWVLTTSI